MKTDSKAAVSAWVRLVRAQRNAMAAVERALREANLPPLEWYDVLLELDRNGPLRARDLQDHLLLAQYNLSRLLDRMEAAGLVNRTPCPDDARCQWVHATDEGQAVRQRMWPVYSGAIDQAVGVRLTEPQAKTLADLLERLT